MNPSTMHPRTAARGLRRAFIVLAACGLLTALLVAPAPALAQGVIQFSLGASTFTRYRVNDDGTNLKTLAFPQTGFYRISATTRSDYPGGRQYLYVADDGSNTASGALKAWCEATGQSRALT